MTTKTLPNDMNELASMWLAAKKQEEDATTLAPQYMVF